MLTVQPWISVVASVKTDFISENKQKLHRAVILPLNDFSEQDSSRVIDVMCKANSKELPFAVKRLFSAGIPIQSLMPQNSAIKTNININLKNNQL